jgi:hypothetical protein
MSVKKIKQVEFKIETSFSSTKLVYEAIKYLKSNEIDFRKGVELALVCLFSPIGGVFAGESREEIQNRIETSKRIFQAWIETAEKPIDSSATELKLAIETEKNAITIEENIINFDAQEF